MNPSLTQYTKLPALKKEALAKLCKEVFPLGSKERSAAVAVTAAAFQKLAAGSLEEMLGSLISYSRKVAKVLLSVRSTSIMT